MKRIFLTLAVTVSLFAFGQTDSFHEGHGAQIQTRLFKARSGPDSIALHFTLNEAQVSSDQIQVDGLSPLAKWGNPEVPVTGRLIAAPEGFEPQLNVVNQEQKEIESISLRVAEPKYRCGMDREIVIPKNQAVYDSQALYPSQVATLEYLGKMHGLRLFRIGINAVQAIPKAHRVRLTTDLELRVDWKQTAASHPIQLPETFYRLAQNLTVNADGLNGSVQRASGNEVMLMIVGDRYKDAVAPFVQWKQAKGIKVELVTYSEAGGSKDNVKKYIQTYYDTHNPKPSYLFMVGNSNTLPAYMESTSSGAAASDWRYTLVSGDDNIPDMVYGRAVVDDESELNTELSRAIEYEKTPEKGDWYPEGTTIASDETGGAGVSDVGYSKQIQDELKAHTYKAMDSFFQGEGTATATNIRNALSKGRTWMTYIGHGSGTSWGSTNTNFSNRTVESLTNEDRLPILIDVACLNASWVNLSRPFGKAWVTQTSNGKNAGAVAYYGASVEAEWDEPAVMAVGIAKSHFEKPVYSVGGSVLAGQLYLMQQMGTGKNTLDNLKYYNLFGDPSLVWRTATPAEFSVSDQVTADSGTTKVTVTATDASQKPDAGLSVTVTGDGVAPVTSTTDSAGKAVVTFAGSALPTNAVLTVTGYNAATYQSNLK